MSAVTQTAPTIAAAVPKKRKFPLVVLALLVPMAVINFIAFIMPVLSLGQISFMESRSGGVLTQNYTIENYLEFFILRHSSTSGKPRTRHYFRISRRT